MGIRSTGSGATTIPARAGCQPGSRRCTGEPRAPHGSRAAAVVAAEAHGKAQGLSRTWRDANICQQALTRRLQRTTEFTENTQPYFQFLCALCVLCGSVRTV